LLNQFVSHFSKRPFSSRSTCATVIHERQSVSLYLMELPDRN